MLATIIRILDKVLLIEETTKANTTRPLAKE
jgi:hypothetical protein